ncbi:unnamed protein product [Absidia cylindrospora]
MFLRLLILESDKNSLWIKIVGIALITVRFADWPYELAFLPLEQSFLDSSSTSGSTCWAIWANGVIILNFIGDALANLFLSGMFVRRLYVHIRQSRKVMSHHNCVIEYIARKSLICLALTFVVNLIMNLFKVTMFLGDRSDAFTVYFAIVESTLLVEALRVDHPGLRDRSSCQQCVHSDHTDLNIDRPAKKKNRDEEEGGGQNNDSKNRKGDKDSDDDFDDLTVPHSKDLRHPDAGPMALEMTMASTKTTSLPKSYSLVNKNLHQFYSPTSSYQSQQHHRSHHHHHHLPLLKSINNLPQTSSAPPFAAPIRPVIRSSGDIEAVPTVSLGSIELEESPKWKPSNRSGKQD